MSYAGEPHVKCASGPSQIPGQPAYASAPVGSQFLPNGNFNRPPGVGIAMPFPPQPGGMNPAPFMGQSQFESRSQPPLPVPMQLLDISGSLEFQEVSEEDKLIQKQARDDIVDANAPGRMPNTSVRDEDYRKQVLKQQQQRLLLLRHASKCPHEQCTVTNHCANMKILWKHIMSCKEHECKVTQT
jgi:TAZ zinc finger